jgi:glycosyltransferase involved in cell wall biosynthesis
MAIVFLGDTFSLEDGQFLGRPIACRTLARAIFLSDGVERVIAVGNPAIFSELNLPQAVEQKLAMVESLGQLSDYFRNGEIDAVLCSMFGKKYSELVRFRNLNGADCPVFGFTHTLSYQDEVGALYRLFCAGIRAYDGILCTSSAALDVMSRLLDQVRETLSFNPVGPDLIHFPLAHAGLQETGPEERCKTHFQVAYVGRLDWCNKADLLVIPKILDCLPADHRIRFVIAGASDNAGYLQILKQYCNRPDIEIAIDISDDDKTRLYRESHVMFSPSDNYQETFGLTVLEAMHHGCIPVVSDFDGYRDTVNNGEDGILLKTFAARVPDLLWKSQVLMPNHIYHGWWAAGVSIDPAQAADELYKLSNDPDRRAAMSKQCLATAQHYDVHATARRFSGLLDSAIQSGTRHEQTPADSKPVSNPFHIDYTDIFSTYPTEHWSDQKIFLTSEGKRFLTGPDAQYVPQLGLLSPVVVLSDISTLLEAVDTGTEVNALLTEGIEPIVFSLALKNGLIGVSH